MELVPLSKMELNRDGERFGRREHVPALDAREIFAAASRQQHCNQSDVMPPQSKFVGVRPCAKSLYRLDD